MADAHHHCGDKSHRQDNSRHRENRGIDEYFPERMQVQFIGRTENEHRQEYVQEHVRIDVSSHVHSPSEKSGFRQEVLSVKHPDNEAETEKADGIWNLELLE